ncbi:MAG: hypothetical protein KGJ66_02210 [Alphaproteobacteria bacterium]|nr:hypothetical protein [Alphaproteobacteria bacterium]
MKHGLIIGIATVLIATGAAAGTSSVSAPIPPAPVPPAPNGAPRDLSPTVPDARSLSQINPTAGPVAPHKKAVTRARRPHQAHVATGGDQRRETRALNWLAAAGYGGFHDLRRSGRDYQATVDDPAGNYTVTIDPDTGRITPASAAADRETQALNLLAAHGYLDVSAIQPTGRDFVATMRQDGRSVDVDVDPARGRITPRN